MLVEEAIGMKNGILAWVSTAVVVLGMSLWAQPAVEPQTASDALAVNEGLRSEDGLQNKLKAASGKLRGLQQEKAYIEAKVEWADKNLARSAAMPTDPTGKNPGMEKWKRELDSWTTRLETVEQQLKIAESEQRSLIAALEQVSKSGREEVLVPGDILQVYVAEDNEFDGLYQVRRGGYIIMPRLPKIFLMGKTLGQAEQEIRKELEASQLRTATVTVESIKEPHVQAAEAEGILYFSGQTKLQGVWPIPADYRPTLVTTLLRVGYDEQYADLEHVRVLRLVDGKGLVETINVKSIMDGDGLTTDYSLESGDIIIVPPKGPSPDEERMFDRFVNVTGEVKQPDLSPIEIPQTKVLTAYVAMLFCGGPTENADLSNVMLVRINDTETQWTRIDIRAIMEGRLPDIPLNDRDFIIVPAKKAQKRVYLTGRVKQDGQIIVEPKDSNISVYQLIVQNGGFDTFANEKKVFVLRNMGNGVRNRIPVNLKDVQKGIIPDLIVENDDIIVVPEKFFSF